MVAGIRATQCRKRGSKRIPSRRETAKTIKKDMRSSFLAQFRADRATAVSDIIVRVAADDLRKSSGRGPWDVGLCVVRVSRRTVHRANIALNV